MLKPKTPKVVEQLVNSSDKFQKGNEPTHRFVVEVGCGGGFGGSLEFGNIGVDAGSYADNTLTVKGNDAYTSQSHHAGISVLGFGISKDRVDPLPDPIDPFITADLVNKSGTYSLNLPFFSKEFTREDNTFWGFSGDIHIIYGCHVKIGWDEN